MRKSKVRLVIDTGVLIPCGDKSDDIGIINSIKKFGNEFPNLLKKTNIVLLLSSEILKEYRLIPRKIDNCHPLPKFHASFKRIHNRLQRSVRQSKCKERCISEYEHMFFSCN